MAPSWEQAKHLALRAMKLASPYDWTDQVQGLEMALAGAMLGAVDRAQILDEEYAAETSRLLADQIRQTYMEMWAEMAPRIVVALDEHDVAALPSRMVPREGPVGPLDEASRRIVEGPPGA